MSTAEVDILDLIQQKNAAVTTPAIVQGEKFTVNTNIGNSPMVSVDENGHIIVLFTNDNFIQRIQGEIQDLINEVRAAYRNIDSFKKQILDYEKRIDNMKKGHREFSRVLFNGENLIEYITTCKGVRSDSPSFALLNHYRIKAKQALNSDRSLLERCKRNIVHWTDEIENKNTRIAAKKAQLAILVKKESAHKNLTSVLSQMTEDPRVKHITASISGYTLNLEIKLAERKISLVYQNQKSEIHFKKALHLALVKKGIAEDKSFEDIPLDVPAQEVSFTWSFSLNEPGNIFFSRPTTATNYVNAGGFYTINPHWYGSHSICMGDFGPSYSEAMSDYDIQSAFLVILEFLNSANPQDPAGIHIINWYIRALATGLLPNLYTGGTESESYLSEIILDKYYYFLRMTNSDLNTIYERISNPDFRTYFKMFTSGELRNVVYHYERMCERRRQLANSVSNVSTETSAIPMPELVTTDFAEIEARTVNAITEHDTEDDDDEWLDDDDDDMVNDDGYYEPGELTE